MLPFNISKHVIIVMGLAFVQASINPERRPFLDLASDRPK